MCAAQSLHEEHEEHEEKKSWLGLVTGTFVAAPFTPLGNQHPNFC